MSDNLHTRISSVELNDVITRYPRSIGRNAVLGTHGTGPTAPAVTISTIDGATGWGLLGGRCDDPGSLIGKRVDEIFDLGVGVLDPATLWADFALHDLAGILTGQSVHTILGDHGGREISTYDGSIYFDDLDPLDAPRGIDVVLENVQDGWDDGHRAFKIKIGRGFTWMGEREGFQRDVEVVRAVHDAFPSARLLVDGNNGFSVEAAINFLESVADVGLFWFEEPFNEHRNGLERLRDWRRSTGGEVLIADGEYRPDVDEVVRFAEAGLVDVLLMDVVGFGLTPWRALAAKLGGSGIKISPHAWGLPIKTCYAGQMAVGLADVITVEGVRGQTDGVEGGYAVVDGMLTVPDTPGFGLRVV
ncbi:D-galactarolactone cycloisomerase [Microlunatus endophyticus]|uniref:D-galactarolactone cycloisomerase n=1 Tax=Microlunatus endophyticus TaxID=1716077 RepID=A0A917SCR4_9ACTN|nr:enolase C-terminal domain-like protein [Microlunatus endophyticus]GGL72811.1 D-galactarolactone cycloisomerase [Microlunatus endophyticus]